MSPKLTFTAAIVVAAWVLAGVPAGAQARRDEGRQRGGQRAVQGAPASRQETGRQVTPRSSGTRQPATPQTMSRGGQNRQPAAQPVAPRSSDARQPSARQAVPRGSVNGPTAQRAVPPRNDRYQSPGYRSDDRRGYGQSQGGYGARYSRPYVRPYNFVPYRSFHFSRPYYSFRARLNTGFGLWLGFSVPYPWAYFGDYRPRVYGYCPDGYYGVAPGVSYYGGASFDIQPTDADLYVDGEYVGMVGTFTPYGEPLTLMPGVHRIAIVRDGFRTMEWDVRIEPGQVIPYRGALVPW